jgi:ATP-binding cassette subfamily B protein
MRILDEDSSGERGKVCKGPAGSEHGRATLKAAISVLASIRHQVVAVRKLISWRHRLCLGGALVVMSLASGANTAIALCLGSLVDAVNPQLHPGESRAALGRIAVISLGLIGLAYLVRETMNVLRRYLIEEMCTRIDKDMHVRVVSHLMKVELVQLEQGQVGALYGRITRSVEGLVRFLRIGFLDFVPALFTGLFALWATLAKQPRMAAVMIGVIPVSLCLTIWQLITQRGVRLALLRSREAIDGTVVEQLGGIDYIRAANTHESESKRVERAAEQRRAKELRHHFQMSLFGSGKAINEGFFHLVVIAYAVYLLLNGTLLPGEILTFSVLYLSVMAPLNEVHRFIDEAQECSLRVRDLLNLLAEPIDVSFHAPASCQARLVLGEPVFVADGLCVSLGAARPERRAVLDGLSITVQHGETIGVAGRSGCGKTTWLRTLLRLAHPDAGHAAFCGVPLSQLSREDIGQMVGYVGQNPFVFAGTIAQNIAYGCAGATQAEIERAAALACIDDEIMAMPGGYEARVAERGQNLSGGQKQRIALARVFLKNPPILVLDESTSALDNIVERRVQQALSSARAERTVIIVAHRLSTLRQANRILVFENGRIVETGTYPDLIAMGGVFAALVRSAEGHLEYAEADLAPFTTCEVPCLASPV